MRHGMTVHNRQGVIQGWGDSPLAPEGRDVARCLGRAMASLDVRRAWSSDAGRARETLRLLLDARAEAMSCSREGAHAEVRSGRLRALVAHADPRLREWGYGGFEGGPAAELNRAIERQMGAALSRRQMNERLPQVADAIAAADPAGRAERFDAIAGRLTAFLDDALADLATAGGGLGVAVTHALAIRSLVWCIDPSRALEPDKYGNGSVTAVGFDGTRLTVGPVASMAWRQA
ncbi:histidine phosphatase family protein [Berryella wangjianweii]|uniref:histidine phosphatase family protein n=1 Tax=Berryella wangjianweii TaxID=2734634 RepID=UPI0028F70B48|nr:histidine phosphatase family protein [Berryella wangjianweii]